MIGYPDQPLRRRSHRLGPPHASSYGMNANRPTIVLVHGAFAESASWKNVIDALLRADYPVLAAANPLRGVAADASALSDRVRAIDGPVVLVAHS
jgi:pimeloyl-ACP methyl ester carboxylesterase